MKWSRRRVRLGEFRSTASRNSWQLPGNWFPGALGPSRIQNRRIPCEPGSVCSVPFWSTTYDRIGGNSWSGTDAPDFCVPERPSQDARDARQPLVQHVQFLGRVQLACSACSVACSVAPAFLCLFCFIRLWGKRGWGSVFAICLARAALDEHFCLLHAQSSKNRPAGHRGILIIYGWDVLCLLCLRMMVGGELVWLAVLYGMAKQEGRWSCKLFVCRWSVKRLWARDSRSTCIVFVGGT